jgi:hypothetical protein
VVGAGDHVDRDVAGLVVAFQPVEHRQARLVRQADIQHDRARLEAPGQGQRLLGGAGDQALESRLARQVADDAGEGLIVFHHQQDAAGGFEVIAVVIDVERGGGGRGSGGRFRHVRRNRPRPWLWPRGDAGGIVGERNGDGEGRALPRLAFKADDAAQQAGEFAGDRQAQARAAILAVDRAVGLAKGVEDRLLLIG